MFNERYLHSNMLKVLIIAAATLLLACRSVSGQAQDGDFYRVTYNITEEQGPGIFVGNTALDTGIFTSGSSQDFQNLKFELFDKESDMARYFSIDEENGVVRTNETIDREEVCGNREDCTIILDMGVYRRTTSPDGDNGYNWIKTIQVVIRVEDKNDNAPEFPQNVVTLTMPENMPAPHRLTTSVASDPDKVGPNSNITYSFSTDTDSSLFRLEAVRDSVTGLTDLAIWVDAMLDREAVDSYYVTILASDSGTPRLSGSVLINIVVTDRNDNAPVFPSSNYTVSVNEGASILDPILTVSAVDRDINDNGQVWYKLGARVSQDIRNHFRVEETDGRIYLTQPVDFEAVQQFVFLVEAWDRGSPPQSSMAYIIVHILDVNDNAPQIILNLSPEGTDIRENEPPGKFLGHISVTDLDSGVHGDVVCEIDDPSFRLDPFEGQPDVYKIVLDQPLDHEVMAVRPVTIRCRDSDKNPLLATNTFDVRVIDVNDNTPQFVVSPIIGAVPENQPPGTNVMIPVSSGVGDGDNVLRIRAVDNDSGDFGRVTYYIPASTNFSIDTLMGTLSTLVAFDRETQPLYTFSVVAQDHGPDPRSSTATVTVSIIDQNDHSPHFDQPVFFLQVRENLPPGSTCGSVPAVDEDEGANARMAYSIVRDENSSRYFSVDRDTGEVTTNQLLDRESRNSYTFTVEVQNPSLPYFMDSAQVVVSVLDENDHAPVITNPSPTNNSITLPNNTTVGSLILRVKAEDGDDPENTAFEYTLPGSDSRSLFQVITVTGELILAREIRAEDAMTHELLLVVSDGGSNPLSATATLYVRIPAEGLRSGQEADILSEPNFIIIVVIVVVTVLVAVLVVTVICCIFRRDKKRKRAGRHQQRQVKDKMYQAAQWVSTHSIPPGAESTGSSAAHESSRSSEAVGDKGRKKEVSFSLEEDLEKDAEVDPDTSGSLGSVFSSPTGSGPTAANTAGGIADNNNLKPPGDVRFLTFISGKSSPSSPNSTPSCYESADGHTYSNTPPIAESEDHTHMQLQERALGEDALSASSGETGTDSGRGGSEDEAHSHRGSTCLDPSGDPRSFHPASGPAHPGHHLHPGPGGYQSFTGPDRGRRKPPSLSSLPEEHPHLTPTGDHALHPRLQPTFFRASAEQLPGSGSGVRGSSSCFRNASFGARDRGGDGGAGVGASSPGDGRDQYFSMDRGGGSDGPFRLRDLSLPSAQQGRRTFHTFGPQHQGQHPRHQHQQQPQPQQQYPHQQQQQQQHPAWRRAKGLDGGWRSLNPTTTTSAPYASTTGTTDDDDLTTTSGSYTLSPDEPPSDLDDVAAFHQIHDIMV